jgi:hypothetical protein
MKNAFRAILDFLYSVPPETLRVAIPEALPVGRSLNCANALLDLEFPFRYRSIYDRL